MRPRVLIASPRSGPISGVEAIGELLFASPLAERWELCWLDTSTARSNSERGRITIGGAYRMAKRLWLMHHTVRKFRPQLVWIQGARNLTGMLKFSLLALPAFRQKIPVVFKHGGDHFDLFVARLPGPLRDAVIRVLNRCYILTEARCLCRQFHGIVESSRIRWAYLGIDAHAYPFVSRLRPARNILFMGHVTRAKGAIDLLTAMPSVARAIPGARLVMAGEQILHERNIVHIHDPDGAWKVVQERPPNVEVPGLLTGPAKRHAFVEADVFCLPSASEGFPVSVLEAMASGIPLVLTPAGALPEVLTEGEHCRFVPYGHPAELAKQLISLLHPTGRFARGKMGAENRRAVESRFTLDHFARGVQGALKDVL